MDLIIETDLGHDPDDFFALCYLMSSGINVKSLLITPGDPDQVAIAHFLRKEIGLNFPIGVSHTNRTKPSSGGVHYDILSKYGYPLHATPDGMGTEFVKVDENTEIFIIGPPKSVGSYLLNNPDVKPKRITVQGGFLPYSIHKPRVALDKFEDKESIPSFNLNGDVKGAGIVISTRTERRFVSKNICHTVLYTPERHKNFVSKDRASELFIEAGDLYFSKHTEKKFHDPTAAVCCLHPEVATWVNAMPLRIKGGWSAEISTEDSYIIADIDYDKLWNYLFSFE